MMIYKKIFWTKFLTQANNIWLPILCMLLTDQNILQDRKNTM